MVSKDEIGETLFNWCMIVFIVFDSRFDWNVKGFIDFESGKSILLIARYRLEKRRTSAGVKNAKLLGHRWNSRERMVSEVLNAPSSYDIQGMHSGHLR